MIALLILAPMLGATIGLLIAPAALDPIIDRWDQLAARYGAWRRERQSMPTLAADSPEWRAWNERITAAFRAAGISASDLRLR